MTGFVFKIQANMDPNHRDRIAFVRVCSGTLQRGMKAKLVRTGKPMSLSAPQFFFARTAHRRRGVCRRRRRHPQPRHAADRRHADRGRGILFRGVPNFAPEILRRVRLGDAMKAKKLKEALQQMAEEGVVQLFVPEDGSPAMVGVVGALQLDVLKERLRGGIHAAGGLRDGAVLRCAGGSRPTTRLELLALHGGAPRRHGARPGRRPGVPGASTSFRTETTRRSAGRQIRFKPRSRTIRCGTRLDVKCCLTSIVEDDRCQQSLLSRMTCEREESG
jgi:hypothetical protein